MATGTDFKIIKEKNLDSNTVLVIKKNLMSGRIFVEFSSVRPKLSVQKSFQDTMDGKIKSEEFSKSIKSTEQLMTYFGVKG